MQTKLCILLIVQSWGIRLRESSHADLTKNSGVTYEAIEALHSAQLIFGIVALALLCISFVLSFLYVGNSGSSKLVRVRIHNVTLEDNEKGEQTSIAGMTAVIKINNESAKNFVLPIHDQLAPINETSTPACIFEFETHKVGKLTFSFIIRDGNIPIHFETVTGNQFVKAEGDAMRVLEFSTFHENELKLHNKRILLNYDIETK